MFRVFPLRHPTLPILEVDGCTLLLDTGATHSLGATRPLDSPIGRLLTTPEPLPLTQEVWPKVRDAVRALGFDGALHGLVGVDRLAALDVVVDFPNGFIALRPASAGENATEDDGVRLSSSLAFGLPCIALRFGDQRWRAALDTGATLGFFVGAPAQGAQREPDATDHHPVLGQFTTPAYSAELGANAEDGSVVSFGSQRMGQLDGPLGSMLRAAGLSAAVGGAILQRAAVRFSGGLERVTVLSTSVHDTLGAHYEKMFDDLYGAGVLRVHAEHLRSAALLAGARRVLDVGAGMGLISATLQGEGLEVVSVEPSRAFVGLLARRLADGRAASAVYLGGAAQLASLDIAPVDLSLFAFGVVDYLLDDDALVAALVAVRQRTRPGGRCWIQPAPRAYMAQGVQRGNRYRREFHPLHADADDLVRGTHRLFLDGALVSEESLAFRHRSEERVRQLAAQAGWADDGLDMGGIYPTVRFLASAAPTP